MKRVLLYFLVAPAIALCSACTQAPLSAPTYTCSGFSDEMLPAWFPYEDGTVLTFQSAAQTKKFTLRNTFTTPPNQESEGFWGNSCIGKMEFASDEKNPGGNPALSVKLSKSIQGRDAATTLRSVDILVAGSLIQLNTKAEEQFTNASINGDIAQIKQLSSVTLGNRDFSDVYLVQIDSTRIQNLKLYEAYFIIGYGLVAYRVAPDQLWIKQ